MTACCLSPRSRMGQNGAGTRLRSGIREGAAACLDLCGACRRGEGLEGIVEGALGREGWLKSVRFYVTLTLTRLVSRHAPGSPSDSPTSRDVGWPLRWRTAIVTTTRSTV